jgi:hypothetical protein
LPSFFRFVLRKNIGSSRMPDFPRLEKGVGLHSAVFRNPALQANGLWPGGLGKPAPTAKGRLVEPFYWRVAWNPRVGRSINVRITAIDKHGLVLPHSGKAGHRRTLIGSTTRSRSDNQTVSTASLRGRPRPGASINIGCRRDSRARP